MVSEANLNQVNLEILCSRYCVLIAQDKNLHIKLIHFVDFN